MQTNLHENPLMITRPLVRPRTAPGSAGTFARLFFVTLTLVILLAAIGVGVWYFWTLFQNTSYKLVAAFLLLIAVSNIICKYALWYGRNYERSAAP